MDSKEFANWLYDTSVMAGMNQEYYQIVSSAWGAVDFLIKFLTALLAISSVIAAAFEMHDKPAPNPDGFGPDWAKAPSEGWWDWAITKAKNVAIGLARFCVAVFAISPSWSWSMRLSAWSALFASLIIASPVATRAAKYDALFDQWTSFRSDIDNLDFEFRGAQKGKKAGESISEAQAFHLEREQQAFIKKTADIERQEPFPYTSLLEYCLRAEERRRGVREQALITSDGLQAVVARLESERQAR